MFSPVVEVSFEKPDFRRSLIRDAPSLLCLLASCSCGRSGYYSKRVSEEIAKRGDSAEDYYENQEKEAGKLAAQESTEEETEAAESRVDAEDTSPDGKLSITSFHGFSWGTTEEDIRKEVILPDMENTIDYSHPA